MGRDERIGRCPQCNEDWDMHAVKREPAPDGGVNELVLCPEKSRFPDVCTECPPERTDIRVGDPVAVCDHGMVVLAYQRKAVGSWKGWGV